MSWILHQYDKMEKLSFSILPNGKVFFFSYVTMQCDAFIYVTVFVLDKGAEAWIEKELTSRWSSKGEI